MASRRLRTAARIVLALAAVGALLVIVIALVRLLGSAPSDATKQDLTVAQVIAATVSAIAALTGLVIARRDARSTDRKLSDLLAPQLLDDERLINRDTEMRELVARIEDSRAVGCHGPRGAGKSFLLEHLTDVINGHRSTSRGQPRPKRVTAAFYFDLADAIGFDEAQSLICAAVLGDPAGTWTDFALSVQKTFKRRRVVLILDNVNSEGIWRQLGQAAHRYCAVRCRDSVVFGSIDQVVLSNLQVVQVPLLGLDLDATQELVGTRGISMTREELVELHREWEGLPFYVRYLTARHQRGSTSAATLSDETIIPDLVPATRQLVAYTALLAMVSRRITARELRDCGLANLDHQLNIAESRTLVSRVPDEGGRRYKIHDIIRDVVLRELTPEVQDAAVTLIERSERGNPEHAALFAMFCDPAQIDAGRLDTLLAEVLSGAIATKNYALIASLHTRAAQNAAMSRFIASDETRADLFCLARASELAGLGRYEESEEEMLTSSVVRTRWRPDESASARQADLRFMQADLAHLLNRYDESAFMFEELGVWAAAHDRAGLEARCVWGHGHVLRHQGRDFDLSLRLLDRAAFLADEAGELFAKAYAICNANGIKVLTGVVPDDQEQRLTAIEMEVAGATAHPTYLLEVWKTQAQLAWWRGERRRAGDIVDAAIERALELNDRLLYNLHFERAEFRRLSGSPDSAIDDYRNVLAFGSGNRDRNLISQAQLGLVLAELTAGQWLHHGTPAEARASVLRAREIAIEADIQLTVQIAQRVTAMLDADDPAPSSERLFLL